MKRKHFYIATAALLALTGLSQLQTKHIGPANAYPDSNLTPGKITTQDYKELTEVKNCGTFSKCHRNTTLSQKLQVCQKYPENCKVSKEIDHLIPLALGGADDVANLWAEPENLTWKGKDVGFHAKDKLETYLINQMKAGRISPKDAQDCILKDWLACSEKYLGKSFGGTGIINDPDQ